MASHTVIDVPLGEVEAELRSEAAAEDWSLAEGQGGPGLLVFRKGVKPTYWGAELRVPLEAAPDTQTNITIDTHESWAITDWGRGSRADKKLLTAIGVEIA